MWCFVMLAPRVAPLTWPMRAGGSSLSPGDLGRQLAGLNLALPNPQALICPEGAGQAERGQEACARTHL